jgi:hypothetical protein
MKGELQWKVIEERNSAIKWGEFADLLTSSDDGWPGVPLDAAWPSHSDEPLCADGWPILEVGVEVSVEVHSDAVESPREHSACRSLMIIECFSVSNLLSLLCHSSVGTSIGRCAPLTVPVEDLTRSSPSESLWPAAVSKALGISLSEVLNLYFGELDKVSWDCLIWDAIDWCRGEEEDIQWLREHHRSEEEAEFRSYYEYDTF